MTSKNFENEFKKLKASEHDEPMLNGSMDQLRVHPIRFPDLFKLYEKQRDVFWTPKLFNFSLDVPDFEKMTNDEQHFIKYVLAFFAQSDALVNINLFEKLSSSIQIMEARQFYAVQAGIEAIHSETYSNMLEAYVKDPKENDMLGHAMKTIHSIKQKGQWMQLWTNSECSPMVVNLIAFAIVEGVFFSGSFCAIYWLKDQVRDRMSQLCASNHDIARDEALHTTFACTLFKYFKHKPSVELVHALFSEAVEIEIQFINESLRCDLIGMNKEHMAQYIKFVANRLLKMLEYPILYKKIVNPFLFMEKISLEVVGNFFEVPPEEYSLAGTMQFDDNVDDF